MTINVLIIYYGVDHYIFLYFVTVVNLEASLQPSIDVSIHVQGCAVLGLFSKCSSSPGRSSSCLSCFYEIIVDSRSIKYI